MHVAVMSRWASARVGLWKPRYKGLRAGNTLRMFNSNRDVVLSRNTHGSDGVERGCDAV